jgi:hypothetical protein
MNGPIFRHCVAGHAQIVGKKRGSMKKTFLFLSDRHVFTRHHSVTVYIIPLLWMWTGSSIPIKEGTCTNVHAPSSFCRITIKRRLQGMMRSHTCLQSASLVRLLIGQNIDKKSQSYRNTFRG